MAHRRAERCANALAALAALVAAGLSACSPGADTTAVQPLPPRVRPLATAGAPAPAPLPRTQPFSTAAGLTPLASPQQLLGSLAIGRLDPFAPLPPAGSRAPVGTIQAALPADFRLLGLISGGRSAQAMVQIGARSGALCPGLRGRCPGPDPLLLPPGWVVERIAAGQGVLVLRQGVQRQLLSLGPGS